MIFFLWGLNVTDGWASRIFFGLVLGVQGYRHKANGVLGHDTSSALVMGFTVGVSIMSRGRRRGLLPFGENRAHQAKYNTVQYSTT